MADDSDETVPVNVYIPVSLRKRAAAIFKKHRTSLSQLLRDGLRAEIEKIEAADKAAADRKKQELDDRRRKTGLRGIGESLLGPSKMEPAAFNQPLPTLQHIDPIYLKHARLILGAVGDRDRVEQLVMAAQSEIKSLSPLLPPKDEDIARQLDAAIADAQRQIRIEAIITPRQRTENPLESVIQRIGGAVDHLLGKKIDPAKVKSFGDVLADDDGDEQAQQEEQ